MGSRERSLILLLMTFFMFQCVVADTKPPKKSPPPWAPAHGFRAKHRYRYYPSYYVYYDIERQLYFFLDNGIWRRAAKMPSAIKSVSGNFVVIEVDTERPYEYFEKHKQKYPGKKKRPKKSKNK